MSYDLMVFDPAVAPRDSASFMEWYEQQTEGADGDSYEDSQVTTPELRGWYDEMRKVWFPMNGPDSPLAGIPDDSPLWNDDRVTGYEISGHSIYCDFRWSVAGEAREAVVRAAEEHQVGFFDASGDGRIIFPGDVYE